MSSNDLNRWLMPTKYNDSNSKIVIDTLNEILKNANKNASDVEKALLIHNYVRENIKFGFDKNFYDYKASDVIKSKIGFCNTKGTLFVTLLRAANIPARQHFVGINMKILDGAGDITRFSDFNDHTYAEVWLNNKWVKVDSYIVDSDLYRNARRLIDENKEKKSIGWGIHADGTIEWDGKNDAFIQCVQNNKVPDLVNNDFGVYDDIEAFYNSGKGLGKRNFISSLMFRLVVNDLNRRINSVRSLN